MCKMAQIIKCGDVLQIYDFQSQFINIFIILCRYLKNAGKLFMIILSQLEYCDYDI